MLMQKILVLAISLAIGKASADSFVPAGQQEDAMLATGYDTDTQRFVGTCVRGKIEQHGQAKANISFSQSISESQLEKELGFEAGGKFRYGAAKIGASASFLKSQRSNAYSIVAVYSGDYKFKNELLVFENPKDPKAKPEEIEKERLSVVGQAVRHDDTRWMETCGEEYVQQIERGAKLFYSIRIDFSSQEEKDVFEASFSYDSSYASAHAHLKNSKKSFSKNTQVTIGALQIGGDVRRVTELFTSKEGEDGNGSGASLGFVKCSMGDFAKCDQVMANAWEYATKDFKEQLKTDPNPNSDSGPAYINYITKKYSAAGIYNKYSSVLNKDVINKRAEIEAEFDRQVLLHAQADHLVNGKTVVLSKRQNKLMKEVMKTVKTNVDRLVKAAEVCYNKPVECAPTATETLEKLSPIDEKAYVIEPEDFRQYCVLAQSVVAKKGLRDSMAGMIEAARLLDKDAYLVQDGAAPVDECLVTDMVFSRNTVISFKKQNISTLAPLREYTHFTSVDLSENSITDVSPLRNWSEIEELNLHDNNLREIETLMYFTNLKKVRVSNNELREIDALLSLPYIERIDARNNLPTVSCEKFTKVNVCLSASIKTDASFMPINTKSPVPLFVPSVSRVNEYEALITGYGTAAALYDNSQNTFSAISGFAGLSYGAKSVRLKNGNILISGGWEAPRQLMEFDSSSRTLRSIGKLSVARADHEMTLLNDGRVLISGGWEQPTSWLDADPSFTAEIYNPETQSTQMLPNMHGARGWHTATLLKNGNVLIVGGYSAFGSSATAEVFNVETGTFVLYKESMGEGRGGHTATLLEDGKVLIVGGFNSVNKATATAEIFDPNDGVFAKIHEPLNHARGSHAAIRLQNGKVLITGGGALTLMSDSPSQSLDTSSILSVGEVFDPSEKSFAQVPSPMYVPRLRHAMLEIKPGLVVVMGGIDFVSSMNSEVFSYTDFEVDFFSFL